jgi:hypothetical protein
VLASSPQTSEVDVDWVVESVEGRGWSSFGLVVVCVGVLAG